ncbi:helix-turn-helix domain-containing protein [Paenibacillus sp. MBLB4367]|uniref:helix-turn-helix domain-containing protein n=1 Tax=Paenibacillus sp. MBLB4367 TaxID=3384767 RepID=UPI003907FAB6
MIFKSSRYLNRLFLFSFILSILPVMLLGAFSYMKSSDMIQAKVTESNMQLLQQIQLRVEQELKTVDNMVIQYANTTLFKNAIRKPLAPRDFLEVEEILRNLWYMKTFEFGIENVSLISSAQDWILNNDGLAKFSSSDYAERMQAYLRLPNHSYWLRENVNGRTFVSLIKKLPTTFSPPEGIVVLQIPVQYLQKMVTLEQKGHTIMIVDSSDRILAHEDSSKLASDVSGLSYIQRAKQSDKDSGVLSASSADGDISVIYRKSSYTGWTYFSVVSIGEITKDSRSIGWITLLTCFVLFFIILISALFGSKRMYNPVRKLFQSVLGPVEPPSGKARSDEFTFIGDRIRSLQDTQLQMSGQIETQIQQLKLFFMQKLFRNELTAQDIQEQLPPFSFPVEWRWLCVLTLEIDTLEGTRYRKQDHDLLMFAINNIVRDLIPAKLQFTPVPVDQSQVTLLCGFEESEADFKSFIFGCAEKIQQTVKELLDLQVSIGISRPFREVAKAPQAFREGIEALNYRIKLGHRIILHIEDVLHGEAMQPPYPSRSASELYDAMRMADREKAELCLKQFMADIAAMELTPRHYELFLSRLLADIVRFAEDSGQALAALAEEQSLFKQLFAIKTLQEVEAWLSAALIVPVIESIENRNDAQYKRLSDEIVAIIHEKYDTDLTLEACASLLNYHPSYIKRVFRKGTGISFSEYLSMHRMTVARKWLSETDMKISEIAERLMYNNSQNFIRQFRKVEGMTPGDYRKRQEK